MANYGYWKKFDPKDEDRILSCQGIKPDDTWQLRVAFFESEQFKSWQKRQAAKSGKIEPSPKAKEKHTSTSKPNSPTNPISQTPKSPEK